MFTRSSPPEPTKLEPHTTNRSRENGVQHRTGPSESGEISVIGNDLKIIGQELSISSRGILQVDGEIEGNVQAAEVIVGKQGKITGMVAGVKVVIQGKVSGTICAKAVVLQASSEVEGDIHHMSFAIEQGAMFDGRSRRAASESDLNAIVEAKAAGQSKAAWTASA